MLSKNNIKLIKSLSQKKYRNSEKLFVVEGKKAILEGLKSKYKCELVVASQSFLEANQAFIDELPKNISMTIEPNKLFEKIAETVTPQGILALFKIPEQSTFNFADEKIIVALENISDPGNLGTIIRTCDWFGIKKILISEDSADIYNPKTVRSTMGSIFHVDVHECDNFYSTLSDVKKSGYKILTAHLLGKNIFDYKPTKNNLVCFCNEANGPSEKLQAMSDDFLNIPSKGKAESLNVASAAAIIISHLANSI